MSQQDINQGEWDKPANWSALTYASRYDTRVIVPRRRCMGWTINFGNPKGKALFCGLLAIPWVVIGIIWLTHPN